MSASLQFLARLGIEYPIIQAPMAGVATPALAAAVCNAGGLGSLGLGAGSVDQARLAIAETRALTAAPFNVNLFCHQPAVPDPEGDAAWLGCLAPLFAELGVVPPSRLDEIYPSFIGNEVMFELLLEQRPAVVSFHFGLPAREWIDALKSAGICLLATATSVREAQLIEHAGIDAIVAQGYEAGGHRGIFDPSAADECLDTTSLLQQLVSQISLPVIAAGGLMDGADIRRVLAQGAVAAQLGTAFILCPESAASIGYRAQLGSERAASTRMTAVLSGRPARGIVNRFITYAEAAPGAMPAAYPRAYDAAKQLHAAAVGQGSYEFAAHWSGQGAQRARALPARELVALLVRELAG